MQYCFAKYEDEAEIEKIACSSWSPSLAWNRKAATRPIGMADCHRIETSVGIEF